MSDEHSETLAVIQLFNSAKTLAELRRLGETLKDDMVSYEWPDGSKEVLRVAFGERMKLLKGATK